MVQPGSSIMPGKVNPVIPEAVAQVALEVEGLAAACRASAALHQLDLSHANPLLAWNLDTMARLLANACDLLVARCLDGLRVDVERARRLAASSPALATALAARIGYERAAEVAKAAEAAGESVFDAARRLDGAAGGRAGRGAGPRADGGRRALIGIPVNVPCDALIARVRDKIAPVIRPLRRERRFRGGGVLLHGGGDVAGRCRSGS